MTKKEWFNKFLNMSDEDLNNLHQDTEFLNFFNCLHPSDKLGFICCIMQSKKINYKSRISNSKFYLNFSRSCFRQEIEEGVDGTGFCFWESKPENKNLLVLDAKAERDRLVKELDIDLGH